MKNSQEDLINGLRIEDTKLINNINDRVIDDLKSRLSIKSKVSIAAASFSIYAFEALKEELEDIEELRFIFTSPTFIKDKVKKDSKHPTKDVLNKSNFA